MTGQRVSQHYAAAIEPSGRAIIRPHVRAVMVAATAVAVMIAGMSDSQVGIPAPHPDLRMQLADMIT